MPQISSHNLSTWIGGILLTEIEKTAFWGVEIIDHVHWLADYTYHLAPWIAKLELEAHLSREFWYGGSLQR